MLESRGPQRWRALGRLLPAEVRERVFEPAFADILRNHLTASPRGGQTLPFGVRVMGTLMGCVPIALPRFFIRRGRLTKVGKITAWGLSLLVVVATALFRIGVAYAESPAAP